MKKDKVFCGVIFIMCVILMIVILMSILVIKRAKKQGEDAIEHMQEGGIAYNENQLNNFTINIQGLTAEIEKKITNKKTFNLKFKEYIYLNGLVDAKNATIDKWQYKNNVLYMILKLDDINQTSLIVKIDSDNIEIAEYNI